MNLPPPPPDRTRRRHLLFPGLPAMTRREYAALLGATPAGIFGAHLAALGATGAASRRLLVGLACLAPVLLTVAGLFLYALMHAAQEGPFEAPGGPWVMVLAMSPLLASWARSAFEAWRIAHGTLVVSP